ncbi:MAG: ABC transporter permease subunit [Planctomycetes bacterium]|nr:ABC transporter permease subunit [Planctomycetota bacterium]MCB9903174.1 ABC transporter permease subunit [Planctomycetota bacterium]
MAAYFARRFLLLIPTFLGITMLVFAITRFVPGGPIDQMMMQLQSGSTGAGEGGSSNGGSSVDIPPEALASLEKYYHFDWPLWRQYLQFLGPLNLDERGVFGEDVTDAQLAGWYVAAGEAVVEGQAIARVRMTQPDDGGAAPPTVVSRELLAPSDGTVLALHLEREQMSSVGAPLYDWQPAGGERTTATIPDIWSKPWSGLLTLDLGNSYKYEVPVIDLIVQRFPISIRFGLTGFLLAYFVCIPLGIAKAVRHGSKFDILSSATVFIGYSIPGWALGVVMLVLFGGGSFWDFFPLGGTESDNFADLSLWAKTIDVLHHMVLPVIAYSIGSFATLTVLTKNALMENLGQDYVRTAFAKGLTERRVIMVHALRNSLIPVCTGLGHALSIVMAGSYLVEKVFNIDGIGLLGFTSIIGRDYAVVMGVLVINTLLMLVGNIISDVLYVLVDPRIRFN